MSNIHHGLDAAASDRKARLAKLASLKRKQTGADTPQDIETSIEGDSNHQPKSTSSKTNLYLSGRNYDKDTNAPKLGFENAPNTDEETVERQAKRLMDAATEKATRDEQEAEKGIDLFKLQPKKPNWDLKRDLAAKLQVLDVRTQNAIARLVRERIETNRKLALQSKTVNDAEGGEEVGLDGAALVEGVNLREREEEEEERKAQEFEDDVS